MQEPISYTSSTRRPAATYGLSRPAIRTILVVPSSYLSGLAQQTESRLKVTNHPQSRRLLCVRGEFERAAVSVGYVTPNAASSSVHALAL
jgi:hypothetical protein